jgi:hypothetical protein
MLYKTSLNIELSLFDKILKNLSKIDSKLILNFPTGRFFYDSWEIKKELKGTCWEEILNTLPIDIGEARIIKLEPETCYVSHADIDDRYHLNLQGEQCYLIDLDNKIMHQLKCDQIWYDMNAGILHTATNFGNYPRIQLVVRKLLLPNIINDPIKIKIFPNLNNHDEVRYAFDVKISPWLNQANKQGIINNFVYENTNISFNLEKKFLNEIYKIIPQSLKIEHEYHY